MLGLCCSPPQMMNQLVHRRNLKGQKPLVVLHSWRKTYTSGKNLLCKFYVQIVFDYYKQAYIFLEWRHKFLLIYTSNFLFFAFKKDFDSPDIYCFQFGSGCYSDCSICMNCHDGPWFFLFRTFCFAKNAIFQYH